MLILQTNAVGNQVVRKGWLSICSYGYVSQPSAITSLLVALSYTFSLVGALKNKEFWFVLTAAENLSNDACRDSLLYIVVQK